jgi:hypothetical protein
MYSALAHSSPNPGYGIREAILYRRTLEFIDPLLAKEFERIF